MCLSLVDGGELDEVLPAVGAAVGAIARQLVEAPHDPVNLDLAVLTGVHRRLELKDHSCLVRLTYALLTSVKTNRRNVSNSWQ